MAAVVHDAPPAFLELRDNFVITEDDYIGYLSRRPIETLVPAQLLGKLRESHFLFLGYGIRDWNLRVFLQRIWGDQQLGAKSWAVEHARRRGAGVLGAARRRDRDSAPRRSPAT